MAGKLGSSVKSKNVLREALNQSLDSLRFFLVRFDFVQSTPAAPARYVVRLFRGLFARCPPAA